MDVIQKLHGKQQLDAGDASTLLQFLQEQATPLLSLRSNMGSQGWPPSNQLHQDGSTPDHGIRQQPFDGALPNQKPSSSRRATTLTLKSVISEESGSHSRKGPGRQWKSQSGEDTRTSRSRSGDVSFNLSSMEEFPPMNLGREKEKDSKPSRRITLTPMGTQPSVPQFSSAGNVWKSNPAFTRNFSSSESPLPLSEERKLLQQERKRQKHESTTSVHKAKEHHKSGQHPMSKSAGFSGSKGRHHSPAVPRKYGHTSQEGSNASRQSSVSSVSKTQSSSNLSRDHSMSGESLNSKISSHSIFKLSHSYKKSTKVHVEDSSGPGIESSNPDDPSIPRIDITAEAVVESVRSDASPHPPTTAEVVPLTSTPFNPPTLHHQLQASASRISSKEALDTLASLYARLIEDRLVPNVSSEVHFIVQMLTATIPPTAAHKLTHGSPGLFQSVDNCVYFAVAVLRTIRHFLTALDKPTMQLLAENIRIMEFQPQLASFFAEAYEKSSIQESSHHSHSLETSKCLGVPFQEETDNSKNFPNIKAFHAFKKQRDTFYSVLREWEKYHEKPNWNMLAALGEKIRSLIRQPAELCSNAHFAKLFQRQLVESCKCTASAAAVEDDFNSLVGPLKKIDLHRLMRLNERFVQPSASLGPCPDPSFSQVEEFFSGFILAADSYVFNHHLMVTLYAELMKLHSSCNSTQPKDLPDLLHTMRVLAKFLGFLEFLPYSNPSPDSLLSNRSLVQPFDILHCVKEACERGHLCATVPWVVEYLSMMDPQATLVHHYCSLLHRLMEIYRSVPLTEHFKEEGMVKHSHFLMVASLGWLFEIRNMPTNMFFEHVKNSETIVQAFPDMPTSLDAQDAVSTELLYACCPFLGEIRSMLAEFAAGLQSRASPIRKIKPLPAEMDSVEASPAKQLQIQLQENFFRGHPPYLKQLCDIVAERVAATVISYCETKILSTHVVEGVRILSDWLRGKCGNIDRASIDVSSEGFEPFSKAEADRKLMQITEDVIHAVNDAVKEYHPGQCQSKAQKALEVLLSGTCSEQVAVTTSGIAATWASERVSKWASDKLRAAVQGELSRSFEKIRKSLRAALKNEALNFSGSSQQQAVNLIGFNPSALKIAEDSKMATEIKSPVVSESTASQCRGELLLERASTLARDSEAQLMQSTQCGSSVEEFKVAAENILCLQKRNECPNADQLMRLYPTIAQLTQQVKNATSILPGIPIPQLVPIGLESIVCLSVDLASHLISYGLMGASRCQPGSKLDLVELLVGLWSLMKSLKLEVPVDRLMSTTSFESYLNEQSENVWRSLSDTLIGCVHGVIVSSAVIEALWLCRKQQLEPNPNQVIQLLKAAALFLDSWYTPQENTKGMKVLQETFIIFREVHFTRLLSTILQELNHSDIPHSLHSFAYLKQVIHPF